MVKLRVKDLGFSSGQYLVVIDDTVATELGVGPHERVKISYKGKEIIALINIAKEIPENVVLVNEDVIRELNIREGDYVDISPAPIPLSLKYIKDRLRGIRLGYDEVRTIVEDIVSGRISEIELTALVTSVHYIGMSVEEMYYFSKAMIETGKKLNLNKKPVLDKHSIGGVPGDKTTMIVVPIIASLGFIIPKTSSRAITSPAGTADRVEVLAPVNLELEEVRKVVLKTNGCMVWGGALQLAPADDKIIQVEYPLAIDPFFVPSIMAKKGSVGATHVVIDIPVGRGAKVKTIGEGHHIARYFIEVGKRLGMQVTCALTYGEEPLGYAIGPALEAKEALETLMGNGPTDLVDKATNIAGILLEMVGMENGKAIALEALRSGKAERKFREIIEAQGGDPNVRPEDIKIGDKRLIVHAERDGIVLWINNAAIAQIARLAGAPKDKGAGVILYAKIGDRVRKGAPLFEIRAEVGYKLKRAEKALEELRPIGVGRPQEQMLISKISYAVPHERLPIIER